MSATLLLAGTRPAASQERGAIALGEAVLGLGVNTRVLLIGAHPDDEDTFLIAWLSRGRHVTTGYLSLTRGDGGQNIIGNELGEALGVIRTEELLAARRVDGAVQFFTRAYDFGFSKNIEDTYQHWPKDSILGDVVRVVRAFRPHVIIGVFSGTPRDGHGHHQVSGILAREAYDVVGDTARFPTRAYGAAWTPLKFYRAARFNPQSGTLSMDVGEYSPLLGRSYAEIAGESRSQHKSQGFGALERKGPILAYLRREATRVNETVSAANERSLFDGIDTSWARFRALAMDAAARSALDSLPRAFADVRASFNALSPGNTLQPLARVERLLTALCRPGDGEACERVVSANGSLTMAPGDPDLSASQRIASRRTEVALALASGASADVTTSREMGPPGTIPVTTAFYNRGGDTVSVDGPWDWASEGSDARLQKRVVAPGGVLRDTIPVRLVGLSQPRWLLRPRVGAMFAAGLPTAEQPSRVLHSVDYRISVRGMTDGFSLREPVVFRFADQVRGEMRRNVAAVPAIAIALEQPVQYVKANVAIDRELLVQLRSADTVAREVRVSLVLPSGLRADSATRTVKLGRYDEQRSLTFRVRGKLAAGEHQIAALAESDGKSFSVGYTLIDYDHIRAQRMYRPATVLLSAVDVQVPPNLRVAYIAGVSDNVAPMLPQLGIAVTVIAAGDVAGADLSRYTTVLVGPRAYEAHPQLIASNAKLLDFARKGGALVVQYGQNEMTQPGVMPYPITLARPADRVTIEEAPVTITDPRAPELRWPNRINDADFAGWVQERALYMPRTFDDRYRAMLAMNDPGEPANRGAILVAPVGDGVYVYTTLSFFRQLPAGVPGPSRLFVNLLSAGITPPRGTP